MAHLMIQTGIGTPQKHELEGERITIGRHPENALVLNHGSVSSHHAEIFLNGVGWTLRDLGSSNGTLLNGLPVQESSIEGGDMITFGGVEAKFVQHDGGELAPRSPTDTPPEFGDGFVVKHEVKDIKSISDSSCHSAAKVTRNISFTRRVVSWVTLIALCTGIAAVVAHQLQPRRSINQAAVQNSSGSGEGRPTTEAVQKDSKGSQPLPRSAASFGLDMSLETLKQHLPMLSFISPSYLGPNTTVAGNDDGDVTVFIWENDGKVMSLQCGVTFGEFYTAAQRAQAIGVLNRLCDDICGDDCRVWIAQQLKEGRPIAQQQFGSVIAKMEMAGEQEQYHPAAGVPQGFQKPGSATLTVTFTRTP